MTKPMIALPGAVHGLGDTSNEHRISSGMTGSLTAHRPPFSRRVLARLLRSSQTDARRLRVLEYLFYRVMTRSGQPGRPRTLIEEGQLEDLMLGYGVRNDARIAKVAVEQYHDIIEEALNCRSLTDLCSKALLTRARAIKYDLGKSYLNRPIIRACVECLLVIERLARTPGFSTETQKQELGWPRRGLPIEPLPKTARRHDVAFDMNPLEAWIDGASTSSKAKGIARDSISPALAGEREEQSERADPSSATGLRPDVNLDIDAASTPVMTNGGTAKTGYEKGATAPATGAGRVGGPAAADDISSLSLPHRGDGAAVFIEEDDAQHAVAAACPVEHLRTTRNLPEVSTPPWEWDVVTPSSQQAARGRSAGARGETKRRRSGRWFSLSISATPKTWTATWLMSTIVAGMLIGVVLTEIRSRKIEPDLEPTVEKAVAPAVQQHSHVAQSENFLDEGNLSGILVLVASPSWVDMDLSQKHDTLIDIVMATARDDSVRTIVVLDPAGKELARANRGQVLINDGKRDTSVPASNGPNG